MTEPSPSEIMQGLGRIEGRIAGFIESQAQQDRRLDAHSARMDKLDERASGVERKLAWYAGAAVAVATVVGYFKDALLPR